MMFVPIDEPAGRAAALIRNWWLLGLRGGFAMLFGLIALLLPGPTLGTLLLLFGAYLIVDGASAIVSAVRAADRHERWGLLLWEGLLNLALATVVLFAPTAAAVAFIYLAAGWALITGAALVVAAMEKTLRSGRWWMGLAGLCSIVWGLLLFLWPTAGAVLLTIWLGAYALVFGAAMLALSLALHGMRERRPMLSGRRRAY